MYALVLIFIIGASVWLEAVLRTSVFRRWLRLLATLAIAAAPFLLWDLWAVAVGHWSFDESQVSSVRVLGGLPIEEIMFFPVVGLAAILTLEGVRAVRTPSPEGESGLDSETDSRTESP